MNVPRPDRPGRGTSLATRRSRCRTLVSPSSRTGAPAVRTAAGFPPGGPRSRRPGRAPGAARPRRWADALAELRALQAEYEAWRDQLPEALADSRTAEQLKEVCDVDLDALDVELPRGFGRD